MTEKARIGFVGLGSMGLPMACNLAAAGYAVSGHDIRAEPMATLRADGGTEAKTALDAAQGADLLILMVVNAAQARQVLLDQGAAAAMAEGGVIALMSTCAPGEVEALASAVAETGRMLVDAPVSGGVVGAEAGSLSIMVSGAPDAVESMRPVFDILGANIYIVGENPGQGAVAKAVNQLMCGVHIATAAEALSLAEQLGLDRQVMLEIVSGSAASSWMLRDRGPRMIEQPGAVTSAVDIFVKDLGIVAQTGRDARVPLPLAAAALQMFLAASVAGDGPLDDSQVIRAYRRLTGRPETG
ncbi:NAD(P)-dependent oxidoreductase [Paracoccus tegillarcae]|uniref:NAD(P)-dependent oxidoreductase n=1 Tax=Paracoccus tegillarcae TaxID=1529068 RepID=A0A2K9ESR3_9RHOB|nr:NAD(P)-dependent oxidoreductase [Paracoccus tegillarcae]AUH32244.1 NAD(P)-dependent oxidoreductase [Paracoccus tegillarcae]